MTSASGSGSVLTFINQSMFEEHGEGKNYLTVRPSPQLPGTHHQLWITSLIFYFTIIIVIQLVRLMMFPSVFFQLIIIPKSWKEGKVPGGLGYVSFILRINSLLSGVNSSSSNNPRTLISGRELKETCGGSMVEEEIE